MALVPHKITALAESDAQGTNGSNIVAGALVSLYDTNGTAVMLFDDAAGSNGSTAKQTDATGQVVVWVTAGEYDEEVNGSVRRRINVGGNSVVSYATTAELQSSRPNKTGQRAENRERANAQYVLASSGYVAQPGDVTAANGRVWELQGINATAKPYFYADHFGASESTDSSVIMHGASDRLTSGGTIKVTGKYRLDAGFTINNDDVRIEGSGRGTGFKVQSDIAGDCIVCESSDPTTTTLFRLSVSDMEIEATVAQTAGALLKVTECAYCTFDNLSIQNGFIGFHGRGMRASEIDNIHIRSGQLYGSVQSGSRFMLLEDSPRPTVGENVELFISNFNFTTNGAAAYIEYGLEVKEADGIWFDSGHIRGADSANGFINAGASPQLLGLKFDNVWFDGATQQNLLMAGSPSGYAGFIRFNGCDFTGASLHAVHVQSGSTFDWIEFNGCSTWLIDNQIAWNIQEGNNVIINGFTAKALNASNAASASCINIGGNVGSLSISGGFLFDSPNIDNAIVIADGVDIATVTGFSFNDLPDASGNITVVNPSTTIFNTSGCVTDQSHGYVTGNTQRGEFDSVATDTAVSVNIGEVLGGTLSVGLKFNMDAHGLIALETADPANVSIIAGGVNLEVSTGVLTGTTGTAGRLTVSVTDAGVLYFENRTGVTRSIVWRMLNREY